MTIKQQQKYQQKLEG